MGVCRPRQVPPWDDALASLRLVSHFPVAHGVPGVAEEPLSTGVSLQDGTRSVPEAS